jgi:hypothetical protein
MGEYIQLADGEVVKVGTCEDCYYATLDQLRAAVADGARKVPGNLPPADYLDPAGGWRYRFPFPDETGVRIGYHKIYDRGVTVEVPPELLTTGEHGTRWLYMATVASPGPERDRFACNVEVGCPLNPDPAHRPQTSPVRPALQVVQQKQVDGQLQTVVRCPYCGALWRLSGAEAAALVADLRTRYADDKLVLSIAETITRGYGEV